MGGFPVYDDRFAAPTGKRALIVGDPAFEREVLALCFNSWNMCVATVPDGLSAMIAIDRAANAGTPFEIVLLKENTQGQSGHEIVHAIRKLGSGQTIRTLVLSEPLDHAALRASLICMFAERPVEEIHAAPLDPRTWHDLQKDIPAAAIKKLARAFMANKARELGAMRADLASGDRKTLRRRAHGLNGAARLFGATSLADAALALETSIGRIDQQAARERLAHLAELFTQASGELTAKLEELSVAA